MMSVEGIVQRPQFDTNTFKPGTAIHLKVQAKDGIYVKTDVNYLILASTPLVLECVRVLGGEVKQEKVTIEDVISNSNYDYQIEVLK